MPVASDQARPCSTALIVTWLTPKRSASEPCQQIKPADKFLPSSLSPTGYITKCTDCIKATAAPHGAAGEQKRVKKRSKSSGALVPAPPPPPPAVRPFSERISPHLFDAAKRFILDYRDGTSTAAQTKLSQNCVVFSNGSQIKYCKSKRRLPTPAQVGRGIVEYKDPNFAEAYGALWAALVRVEALYKREDDLIIEGSTARAARRKA
jgi:hypothetical protein